MTERQRATKVELERLRDRIIEVADRDHPLSVRNLFYQLLADDGSGAYVEKSESGYHRICRLKTMLCREKLIPWRYFTDSSRSAYLNTGYTSLADSDFVNRVADLYRRDVWEHSEIYPQLWVESRSLAPTLSPLARSLGVDLYPSAGMASDSFVHGAAEDAVLSDRETFLVIYVGDYDPAGLQIADTLEVKLGEHLADVGAEYGRYLPTLAFQRVAVTAQQILDLDLPTKPVKATQSRRRYDLAETVEAEAMRPAMLREIVANAFEGWIDTAWINQLREVEAQERNTLIARLEALKLLHHEAADSLESA